MQSLGPIVPRKSLNLGSIMHKALAQWLLEPQAKLDELFDHAAADDLVTIKTNYFKKVGAAISESELEDFYDGCTLGKAMCENYQQKYTTPIFEGFTLLQPEVKIEVPIPNTSPQHSLSLRLDGLIKRWDGALFILEHKTYNSRPRLDVLQMNDQFLAYIWGAEQLGLGNVMGIAYDGMWSRPKPPRGSQFDDLFVRLLITKPRYEIDNFREQLRQEVADMFSAQYLTDSANAGPVSHFRLYPNRRWEGCFDCDFEKLCAAQTRGEDYEHMRDTWYIKLDRDKEAVEED